MQIIMAFEMYQFYIVWIEADRVVIYILFIEFYLVMSYAIILLYDWLTTMLAYQFTLLVNSLQPQPLR